MLSNPYPGLSTQDFVRMRILPLPTQLTHPPMAPYLLSYGRTPPGSMIEPSAPRDTRGKGAGKSRSFVHIERVTLEMSFLPPAVRNEVQQ